MSENENDFDALRRLLALKRHEIPPPGYFEDFSSHVIARIRAGDTAPDLPFLLRFLQWFESRPAFPVAFASFLCLGLLGGIITIQQNPEMTNGFGQPSTMGSLSATIATPPAVADASQSWVSGTTATNPPAASSALFGSQPSGPTFEQVGFSPGN